MSTPLSPEDRDRLEDLFERAADLPATEHAAFLARECGSNQALRAELSRLLAAAQHTNLLGKLQPAELETARPLQPGTRIGAYKLLERVGDGGMGEVYAAEQQAPVARKVALKVIKLGMDSQQVVARFDAERQALARMSHPHIAQVYDGGITDDGRPFFVMELVAGVPIIDYCDRHQLSTDARLELFLQICDGVQHAHLKGIIHRDLKPSNLLVTVQDARASAKIIDFGVARATTGRLAEQTLHTMIGQIVGTLDYMSPEQADPTAVDIDTRSDIYSLGVVLYQLLSGLLPFDLTSVADVPLSELQRRIREQDPPTPSTRLRSRSGSAADVAPRHGTDERSLIRQLAGDLDWICLKALEKDPARRYQSAADLAADVRRHLADEAVLAGRPGLLYRTRKLARRNRTAAIAGMAIAAFALIGGYGVIYGQLEAQAKEQVLLSLSDNLIMGGLEAQADTLWPALPDKIPDLEGWLTSVGQMVARLPVHRNNLAAIRARALDQVNSAEGRKIERELTALIERLANLEARLEAGNALDTQDGWGIEKRLAEARRLEAGFAPGGKYAQDWARMLPEIRATYPDLDKLERQAGLVPLWQDPDSHLWLFAHLLSGERPERDANGKVVMKAETGLVMALLPGGNYDMGTQTSDVAGTNYVRPEFQRALEDPPHEVVVPAFFLSKFEMTQAQWERLAGWNPSGSMDGETGLAPTYPVNLVTWAECDRITSRLGLTLPHEEQWEYAARGNQHPGWPWWTGPEPESLDGAENVRHVPRQRNQITHVGSLRANSFGLYDMLGNVSEWCSNQPYYYGSSGGVIPSMRYDHVGRGGNHAARPKMARSAMRMSGRVARVLLGLRPARPVVF